MRNAYVHLDAGQEEWGLLPLEQVPVGGASIVSRLIRYRMATQDEEMKILKQSTSVTLRFGPFVDATDGITAETGLTVTVRLSKNGAAFAARNDATALAHDENGYYSLVLNTTDTGTAGPLIIAATDSANYVPVFQTYSVITTNVYDAWIAGTGNGVRSDVQVIAAGAITSSQAPNLDAAITSRLAPTTAGRTLDVTTTGEAGIDWANVGAPTTTLNLSGTTIATSQVVASVTGAVGSVTGAVGSVTGAVGSVTGNVGGNVTGSVGSVATGGITTASFAAGAVNAAAIGADAITAAKIANGAIDAATFAAGAIDATAIATDAIGSAQIAASAVTEIQSGLATSAALATVQADTDDIQTRLPAALVSGRIDASVGAMAANTLTSTALATSAVDEIVDQVWDEALAGHAVGGSAGAALSGAGSAGDPWTTLVPGVYGAGTAGAILGANLDAAVTSRLAPTVASRTLDVTATGAAGVDWANVENATTTLGLTNTTISSTQVVASMTGNLGGNVVGSVASVVGNVGGSVGSVVGAVGSVTNNVGGNVTGSVGSVLGSVGSVTGNLGGNVTGSVGSVASGGLVAASFATDSITSGALAASAVAEIQSGLALDTDLDTARAGVVDIQARLPSALVGGRMDSIVGAMAADTITAASIAAGAITSSEAPALANLDVAVSTRATTGAAMTLTGGERTAIATAARDIAITGSAVGSLGEAVQVIHGISGKSNMRIDNTVYDVNGFLTSCRLRVFPDSATTTASTDGGITEGEIFTITLAGTPDGTFPVLPATVRGTR